MKTTKSFSQLLLIFAIATSNGLLADDIDIFLSNPAITGTRPNVLLVIDNAASNNSNITKLDNTSGDKLEMIKEVLNNIIDPLNSSHLPSSCTVGATNCITKTEVNALLNNINLGVMVFNPSGSDKGGYIRYHIRPMNVASHRTDLLSKVNSISTTNNAPYAKSVYEAYLYYGGKLAYAGFDSNQYDPDAKSGSNYVSPATDSCQSNYIIFVGNGGPDSAEDPDANTLLSGIGGVLPTDPVSFTPNNHASNWLDETARTLKKQDVVPGLAGTQNVTSYTIAIQTPADNNFTTKPMTSARKLLESAAALGGGEYFLASDGQAVMRAFVDLFSKLQSVSSVFAASTLPVSVNVRGESLNQVYMGQFRPDADAKPRWPGNLKLYQLALNAAGQPILADTNGQGVEDTVNGFLLSDKTSFWTSSSTYWSFEPMGTPASANDAPDGNIVEKGGAGQRLRQTYATSQDSRNIYTCNGPCVTNEALSAHLFKDNNSGLTAGMLGVADATARTDLINWVRGADNRNNEDANNVLTDIRARIHGDLIHSRPAVVNYNRNNDDRDIVVYYGANDGLFRAVKGGLNIADGYEKWAMVFPEFHGTLTRLRENTPDITVDPKPYFADGPVSVYQKDANNDGKIVSADGDKAYIYVGMRRGGKFVYALNVSNPDAPTFLWKIAKATTGFGELGQTWSTLRPAKIRAEATDPVVIFGAGYDAAQEDLATPGNNTEGRGIFVVNARTGALIKLISPTGMASVPGDVTVLDRNADGYFDRIYAADTKGNIWRVDIDDADPNNWQSHKLAYLGGSGANARKFLNKPDVVMGTYYDAVLIGSGDREHPFESTVTNRFYMLKDTQTGLTGGYLCTDASNVLGPCVESDFTDVTSNPYQNTTPNIPHGWYVTLAAGEKVVGNAITAFGTTVFGTNRPTPPAAGVCTSNLGEARLYAISFEKGSATYDANADGVIDSADIYTVIPGGGFPPSPVYARVQIPVNGVNKPIDVVCTGSHCIPPGGVNTSTSRYRTYWYLEQK